MTDSISQKQPLSKSSLRMTQPQEMKTKTYVCGIDKLNGFDVWALFEASAVGDAPKVKALVEKDRRLVNAQSAYQFPLHMAVYAGHAEIVRLLLNHGADPGQSTYTYNSWDKLLHVAEDRGYQPIEALLRRAMKKQFNFTPEDAASQGRALFEACCRNHVEVARLLLEHGADANAGTDSNGCCLTIGQVYHGDNAKPVQQLLRQHGAFSPPYSMTVREMKQAIRGGHEVVGHDEFLSNVITQRDRGLFELYLDSDPTVLQRIEPGCGLIDQTSMPLIKKLLARGLDPNRTDWLGRSFLHECAEKGERSLAAIFLDAGADINAREVEFQGTPLAAAVRSCVGQADPSPAERQRQMVEFLLKRGAAINLPGDQTWSTPLAWATRHELSDLVELLTRHGAN